jgi:hypothetical protein
MLPHMVRYVHAADTGARSCRRIIPPQTCAPMYDARAPKYDAIMRCRWYRLSYEISRVCHRLSQFTRKRKRNLLYSRLSSVICLSVNTLVASLLPTVARNATCTVTCKVKTSKQHSKNQIPDMFRCLYFTVFRELRSDLSCTIQGVMKKFRD